jgi:hypothetical protein
MRHRLLAVGLAAAAAIGSAACDEKLSTLAGPTPSLEPTFSSIQSQIFEASDSSGRAACITCHTSTGRTPAGGLDLSHAVAYDQLVNAAVRGKAGATRVVPGSPETSYLVAKLEGSSAIVGRRMPFNGPPFLTAGQITIIRRWVETGAPRN